MGWTHWLLIVVVPTAVALVVAGIIVWWYPKRFLAKVYADHRRG